MGPEFTGFGSLHKADFEPFLCGDIGEAIQQNGLPDSPQPECYYALPWHSGCSSPERDSEVVDDGVATYQRWRLCPRTGAVGIT